MDPALTSPVTTIFLQDSCLQHKYIRTRDSSHIVERPERLRAVKIGLCAAISRLEEALPVPVETPAATAGAGDADADSLVAAIENLRLEQDSAAELSLPKEHPVQIVQSSAKIDILHDPAVKYIHGDVDGDIYLEKLVDWARHSAEKVSNGGSEIPSELPQGDLYMCPTSLDAIQGALGTVCEAVDAIMTSPVPNCPAPPRSAFVAVRPPGHHCGEDTPCGFCFVNNVAVGAAHAHLKHGIRRIVILDIDLHHGNGTQSIVWQINEEAYRTRLAAEAGVSPKTGLQVYYGSVHDILSFPCEDGKPDMVQAASNVHLAPFESEEQFWNQVTRKAEDFVKNTGGTSDDTLVFISAGFDASEHETPSMSRHNRKVPTSFFYRFTQDVCKFANKWAQGRIVSVLEGGYSDKALLSGAMAHLAGLTWWSPENVQMPRNVAGHDRRSVQQTRTPTMVRSHLCSTRLARPAHPGTAIEPPAFIPPSSMTLRARKPAGQGTPTGPATSPDRKKASQIRPVVGEAADTASSSESTPETTPAASAKKLPRVILKVGPRPET
ncbi:histone deacetylase domain-containing protein [Russula brevipes]|nr:histone deacetylase domain-containing protein [Russula brevipes]